MMQTNSRPFPWVVLPFLSVILFPLATEVLGFWLGTLLWTGLAALGLVFCLWRWFVQRRPLYPLLMALAVVLILVGFLMISP